MNGIRVPAALLSCWQVKVSQQGERAGPASCHLMRRRPRSNQQMYPHTQVLSETAPGVAEGGEERTQVCAMAARAASALCCFCSWPG